MTVVAATDFSESSRRALHIAGREARLRGEPLCVVHSVELERQHSPWRNAFATEQISPERLQEHARRRLETFVREQLPPRLRPARTVYRTAIDAPAATICQTASQCDSTAIAIGATGRGSVESFVIGSTAEEVVRSAPAPVFVSRDDDGADRCKTILVPVDLSECSGHGLEEAIRLARRDEARLIVLHEAIMRSPGFGRPNFGPNNGVTKSHRPEAESRVAEFLEQFDLDDIDCETLVRVRDYDVQATADTIVHEAGRHEVDLLVMGTHGRRGFRRFLMGSTTLKVLHRMPCCLLTVLPRNSDRAA